MFISLIYALSIMVMMLPLNIFATYSTNNILTCYNQLIKQYKLPNNRNNINIIQQGVTTLTNNYSAEYISTIMHRIQTLDICSMDNPPHNADDVKVHILSNIFQVVDAHTQWMPINQTNNFKNLLSGTDSKLGFTIVLKNNYMIVDHIDNNYNNNILLKPNDKILSINNTNVTLIPDLFILDTILRPEINTFNLVVERNHKKHNIVVKRSQEKNSTVYHHKLGLYDYINISLFNNNTPQEFKDVITKLNSKNTNGIVLDLRNNPGGVISSVVSIIDMLISEGNMVNINSLSGDNNETYKASKKTYLDGNIPILVVINHNTASAAEILSLALQTNNRAMIFGERSFGKGTMQDILQLSDGSAVKITNKLYTVSGISPQVYGVQPNISTVSSQRIDMLLHREKKLYLHLKNPTQEAYNKYKTQIQVNHISTSNCGTRYNKNLDQDINCAIYYIQKAVSR